MNSVIVLDSSDEDEAPSKKMALPRLNSSTTISVIDKSKTKNPLNESIMGSNSAGTNNSIVKNNTLISNMLLSPTLTKTIEKPKLQTFPKINTAFTLNSATTLSNAPNPLLSRKSLEAQTQLSTTSNIVKQKLQDQQKQQFLPLPTKQNSPTQQQQPKQQVQKQQQQQQKPQVQQQQAQQKQQQQQKQQVQQKQKMPVQQQQKQQVQQPQKQQVQQTKPVQQQQKQQLQQTQQKQHRQQVNLRPQPQQPQQQQNNQVSPQQKQQLNLQQQQTQQMQMLQQQRQQACLQLQKLQEEKKRQGQQKGPQQQKPQGQQQQKQQGQQFQQRQNTYLKQPNQQQKQTQLIEMLPQPQLQKKIVLQQKQKPQKEQLTQQKTQKLKTIQPKEQQFKLEQTNQRQLPQFQHRSIFPEHLESQNHSLQQKQNQPLTQIQYPQQQQQHQQQQQQKLNPAFKQAQASDLSLQHVQQQRRIQQPRQYERKRKTPTPPTPVALTVAGTHPSNIFLPRTADGAVSMLPLIQSVHSMAVSPIPPLQLLSKLTPPLPIPTTAATVISSSTTTTTTAFNCFFQSSGNTTIKSSQSTNNNVDNFKIHLPLKKPISIANTVTLPKGLISTAPVTTKTAVTTTTKTTVATAAASTSATSTASVLRGIKRIKPQTVLKNTDEAWLLQQQKRMRSSASPGRWKMHDDDEIMEITPTTSSSFNSSVLTSGSADGAFSWAPGMQQLSPPVPVSLHLPSLSVKRIPPTPPRTQTPQSSPAKSLTPTSKSQTVLESSAKPTTPVRRQSTPKTASGKILLTPPRRITPTHGFVENATITPVFDLTNSPEKPNANIKTATTNSPSSSSSITATNATAKGTTSPRIYIINPFSRHNSSANSASRRLEKSDMSNSSEKQKKPPDPLIPDFEELLNVCRAVEPTDDMDKLIKKRLIRCYYSVDTNFVKSLGFRNKLRSTIEHIKADPQLVYYNLKNIVDELKEHRVSPAKEGPAREISVKVIPAKECQTSTEAEIATSSGSTGCNDEIKQLTKTLHLITKRIEQLEQSEVDWDDDDSSYLQVERFQKRACQIYEKICQLRGENKSALNPLRKKIKFNGTDIPQFNRTLQAYVNQTNEFPDYFDVLRVLEHCNVAHSLGLAQFEMKHIAQDAFIKVGKCLQSRRKTDLYETVTHYTGNKKDPATSDPELLAKLSENQKLKKNINDIFEKYAREQDQTAEEIRLKKAATLAANSGAEGTKLDKEKNNGVNVSSAIIAAALAAEESDGEESDQIDKTEGDDDEEDDEEDVVEQEEVEEEDDDDCVEIVGEVIAKLSNSDESDYDDDDDDDNNNEDDEEFTALETGKVAARATKAINKTEGSSNSSTSIASASKTTTLIQNKTAAFQKLSDGNAKPIGNNNSLKLNNNNNHKKSEISTLLQNDNAATNSSNGLKHLGTNLTTTTNSKQIPKQQQLQHQTSSRPPLATNANIGSTTKRMTLPPPPPIVAAPATNLKICSVSSLNESIISKNSLFQNNAMTSSTLPKPVHTFAEIVISDEES